MNQMSKHILLGIAAADALGAPVEFKAANELDMEAIASNYQNEPHRLTGFGTWGKPVGTYTDDTAMSLCTAEFLLGGTPTTTRLMKLYSQWLHEGHWTADGEVFDIGNTILKAITKFDQTGDASTCGPNDIRSNGNGALMRILPLLPFVQNRLFSDVYAICEKVTSCTHAHSIAIHSAIIYMDLALKIVHHRETFTPQDYLNEIQICVGLLNVGDVFGNFFEEEYEKKPIDADPNGYVVGSLEIAIHSFLSTNSYREAVLKAISYGGDTDTNAAITGGLAALKYGYESIPEEWLAPLKRKEEIIALADQLDQLYGPEQNDLPLKCEHKKEQ